MTGNEYSTPFGYRYRDEKMLCAWSEFMKYKLMTELWVGNHNHYVNLVGNHKPFLINTLKDKNDDEMVVFANKVKKAEELLGHETVAILDAFEKETGSPALFHAGLTSSDIGDQVVLFQSLWSVVYITEKIKKLIKKIHELALSGRLNKIIIGRTHLQIAEPTTVVHRQLVVVQELLDWVSKAHLLFRSYSKYIGVMSGAMGNYANERAVLRGLDCSTKELRKDQLRAKLQTLPRYLELDLAHLIVSLSSFLHKQALDFRLDCGFGESAPSLATTRVGSSAMPFKNNPIEAEQVNSLARHAKNLCGNAWDNSSNHGLDRTLDDSANRRIWLPEAFLSINRAFDVFFGKVYDDMIEVKEINPYELYDKWSQSRTKAWNLARKYLGRYDYGFEPLWNVDNDIGVSMEMDVSRIDDLVTCGPLVKDATISYKFFMSDSPLESMERTLDDVLVQNWR